MQDCKYHNLGSYLLAGAMRRLVKYILRFAVCWRPAKPLLTDKYTIIIGCPAELEDVLRANLYCLSRQDLAGLHRVVVVMDCAADERMAEALRGAYACLPLTIVFLTFWQRLGVRCTAAFAKSAWVKCWLSWAVALAKAETESVLIHDLDALVLNPRFIGERFEQYRASGSLFHGLRYYEANGIVSGDKLVTTFELVFNARMVRERFHAVDAFNRVSRIGKRRIEFDTFLWIEHCLGSTSIAPCGGDDMVHPSQMICQYVEFTQHGRLLSTDCHNLLLLPLYASIGGRHAWIEDTSCKLANMGSGGSIEFAGRQLPVTSLKVEHVAWIRNQAERVERALFQKVRPLTARYLDALEQVTKVRVAAVREEMTA